MTATEHGRVLVAKVGLDGHDRGVKVVARILRDAGFEVIYTGLFQTPDTVAAAAVDEDVDAIGLSMLSGAHMTLAPLVVEKVRERGADIPVVVGGIVPDVDVPKLLEAGVAGVLTPGATGDQVVAVIRDAIAVARLRWQAVDRVERLTNLLALLLETTRPLTLVEIAGELRRAVRREGVDAAGRVRAGQGGAAGDRRADRVRRAERRAGRRQRLLDRPRPLRADRPAPRARRDAGPAGRRGRGAPDAGSRGAVEARPRRRGRRRRRDGRGARAGRAAGAARGGGPAGHRRVRLPRQAAPSRSRTACCCAPGSGTSSATTTSTASSGRTASTGSRAPSRRWRAGRSSARRASTCAAAFPSDPKRSAPRRDDAVAVVRVDADRAAERRARARVRRGCCAERADGSVEVEVPCANVPAFRSWVLGLLDHAEVVGPPEVRAEVVAWLRRAGGCADDVDGSADGRGAPARPAGDAAVADGAWRGAARRGRPPLRHGRRSRSSPTSSWRRCAGCRRSSTR